MRAETRRQITLLKRWHSRLQSVCRSMEEHCEMATLAEDAAYNIVKAMQELDKAITRLEKV